MLNIIQKYFSIKQSLKGQKTIQKWCVLQTLQICESLFVQKMIWPQTFRDKGGFF